MNKKEIIELLQGKGIKPTLHRIGVMEVLDKLMAHPTADELLLQLQKDYPTISLATVYNTLEILEEKSIIRAIKHNNFATKYDFYRKPHFHLFSKNTNEIIDYTDDHLLNLIKNYFEKNDIPGYEIQDINLEIIINKKV